MSLANVALTEAANPECVRLQERFGFDDRQGVIRL